MTLDEIKKAVVKISVNNRFSGTGFFIAKDIVITNAHVIDNSPAGNININNNKCTEIICKQQDENGDYALLRCDCTAEFVVPVNFDFKPSATENQTGRIFGFGAEFFREPTTFDAKIINVYQEKQYELQVDAAMREVLPGDSGSPFVFDDAVIGLIFARRQQDNTKAYAYLFSDLGEIKKYVEKMYNPKLANIEQQIRNIANIHGDNNIVFQGVQANNISINIDTSRIQPLLSDLQFDELSELKQMLGDLLKSVPEIKDTIVQTQQDKIEQEREDVSEFFDNLRLREAKSIKKRIATLMELKIQYEDLLLTEDDPRHRLRWQRELDEINKQIESEKQRLREL